MNTNTSATDILIGAIDHHDWADVCCWHRSALRSGFTGRVVLLCYEHMTTPALRRIGQEGITIINAKSRRGVNEDRFKDVAEFAASLDHETRILMCDVRDVAFQRSIHAVLDEMLAVKPLACASEGISYGESAWNLENVKANFPHLIESIAPLEIFCAGVIAGRAGEFTELCQAIWQQSIAARSFNGDQVAMNLVMRTAGFEKRVHFMSAQNASVCHHGNRTADKRLHVTGGALHDAEFGLIGVFHQYTRLAWTRLRTLMRHHCLLSFYGGKLMTALRRKLHMEPVWVPYWAEQRA